MPFYYLKSNSNSDLNLRRGAFPMTKGILLDIITAVGFVDTSP